MVRRLTHREWVSILLAQGSTILCFRCREPITHADDCEREHLHERALEGGDEAQNARISHSGCHDSITFGNKATTAGSSVQRIAKAKRIAKARALDAAVIAGEAERPRSSIRSGGFDKRKRSFGQSAGFRKRTAPYQWAKRTFGRVR